MILDAVGKDNAHLLWYVFILRGYYNLNLRIQYDACFIIHPYLVYVYMYILIEFGTQDVLADSLIADGDTICSPYVFSNCSYDPLFHEYMK